MTKKQQLILSIIAFTPLIILLIVSEYQNHKLWKNMVYADLCYNVEFSGKVAKVDFENGVRRQIVTYENGETQRFSSYDIRFEEDFYIGDSIVKLPGTYELRIYPNSEKYKSLEGKYITIDFCKDTMVYYNQYH
ncbi:hypothetical protein [Flammeovirga aprica]|uniref:Uncharacterized protein n=1 Tax=Flammeovirga aprica JL-4 TaxID=694437 RepID=A0A7X9RWW8_9BACT|nr:hypothetical protein [Flammeovirga aprica]NME70231.1 hypothetical protein [Flammeovirga aprica JL-4]